jgi:quinol monooxygenase YgiN
MKTEGITMIHVIASIEIKPNRINDFLEEFHAVVPAVLEEKGCIAYGPTMDVDIGVDVQELDANIVTIVEQWESVEALQAHLVAPHMTAYRERVKDMVALSSIKVLAPC